MHACACKYKEVFHVHGSVCMLSRPPRVAKPEFQLSEMSNLDWLKTKENEDHKKTVMV